MKLKNTIETYAIRAQKDLVMRMMHDNSRIVSGEMEIDGVDCFVFSNDAATVLYVVPDTLCCVDKEKVYKTFGDHTEMLKGLKKSFVENESRYQMVFTDENIEFPESSKIKTLVEYEVGGTFIYLDKKRAKEFDGCTFYGNSAKGFVSAYLSDKLVGIVCPVVHRKAG